MCHCSDSQRDESGDDQTANVAFLPEGGCDLLGFLGNGNDVEFRFSTHLSLILLPLVVAGPDTRCDVRPDGEPGSLLPLREGQSGTESQSFAADRSALQVAVLHCAALRSFWINWKCVSDEPLSSASAARTSKDSSCLFLACTLFIRPASPV